MPPLPPVEPPPPPMSMTSLPVGVPRSPSSRPCVQPPVLASDILREEVAPIAPGQTILRVWLAGFSLVFGLAALASFLGLGSNAPGVFGGSLATAIVAAVAALVSVPYAARASLAVVVGLVPLLMGVGGDGPLSAIGFEGTLNAGAGLLTVTALPGALLFRARYRAFAAARIILGVALAASGLFLVLATLGTLDSAAPNITRVADGAAVITILTAFFGFMGEETSGGCSGWAALLLAVHALRLASQTFVGGLDSGLAGRFGPWGFVVGGVGEFFASTIVAYAIFQLLAAIFASSARKVDVHRIVGASAETDSRPTMSSEYP